MWLYNVLKDIKDCSHSLTMLILIIADIFIVMWYYL